MESSSHSEAASPALSASHPDLFVRNATGLVRNVTQRDNLLLAFLGGLPTALLAYGVFFALAGFPGGNFFVAGLLCIPLALSFSYAFGLLATAIPRSGGDYIVVSRILHPLLGVVSMFCMTLAQYLSIAAIGKLFASLVAAPGLQITGLLANSKTLFNAGTTVAGSNGWQFAIAVALIVITTAAYLAGTRWVRRLLGVCMIAAMVGLIFSVVVALFTSKGAFISHFNAFAKPFTGSSHTYADTMHTATKAGVPLHPKFSLSKTIPIVGVFATSTIFAWGGAYVAGELRQATSTKTANRMALGGFMAIAGTLLFAAVFFHAWGQSFLTAIYGGGLPAQLGSSPTYFFLTSAQLGSPVLGALLCLAFGLSLLMGMGTCMITPTRSFFAMGFDGIMPRSFATVSERTNAPVVAILVTAVPAVLVTFWAIFISTSFLQVIVYATLVQLIAMGLVGAAAVVFPYRRRQLFQASSSQRAILGVPLVTIAGVLAIATVVFLYWLYFKYAYFGLANKGAFVPWAIGTVVLAIVAYFTAKAMRRRQGIDLDLVYAEIPPE